MIDNIKPLALSIVNCAFAICNCFRPGQQLGKAIVCAGHPEVRLSLEGAAQVMDTVPAVVRKLHNGEDKGIGFVKRIKNLVAGDGDGFRAADTALDLQKRRH